MLARDLSGAVQRYRVTAFGLRDNARAFAKVAHEIGGAGQLTTVEAETSPLVSVSFDYEGPNFPTVFEAIAADTRVALLE